MMIRKVLASILALTTLARLSPLDETHLARLRQSSTDKYGFNSTIAERFGHYDAWLIGFRSDEIIPSALNCSNNIEHSYYVWNDTQTEWANKTDLAF